MIPSTGAQSLRVHRIRDGKHVEALDWVAEEVPVALEFNGISHAVMLATPLDLEDFALGFSLSEGILEGPHELYGIEETAAPQGITLRLEVSGAAFARLKHRRRSMAGRTGCGLCGAESLGHVVRDLTPLGKVDAFDANSRLARQSIAMAMQRLASLQPLQQATGAVHAAAWCSSDGVVRCLREDVGRHNALDKLVGALAGSDLDASTGLIAVTSRASFEMVQKAVVARAPVLVAVSAPTSLAVAMAERAGMTLVGFARELNLVVYSHPQRVALDSRAETLQAI